jgi:hypothetical protein
VLLWTEENVEVSPGTFVDRRRMKTLQELGHDLADVFEEYSKIDPGLGIDIIPCRIQILKKTRMRAHNETQSREIYDVVYDDDNFARSKVYAGAYTTVTWQNVTPASGDVLMQQDPLAADTINHVPLKGKIYTFSGPVPKVWDKHRAEMHELFMPEFFEGGRYLLPNSKLHNIDEFAKPPRGKSIWSNCIGEQSIGIGPGQFKKLRLNYRVNDTLEEFFKRYRDADVDHLKMGRTVCLCLEPAIRRQHIGEPIPYAAVKLNGGKEVTVQYEPYTYKNIETDPTKLPRWKKMLRALFTFPTFDETRSSSDPLNTAGVHYWYKDPGSPFGAPEGLVKGGLIGDTAAADFPTQQAEQESIDSASHFNIILHNKVLCDWTDGAGRVSKGDPLMFNVQINRLYTGSARLRREAFLTVDNSGIKRKWNERLVPNVGAGPAQNPADFFEDHELQSALQVGIREIIPEGQPGNLQVDSGGVHQISDITTVTGGGLTAAQTTAAFVAALGQTGLDVAATGNTLMDLQNVTVMNPAGSSEYTEFQKGRDVDIQLAIRGPHYNVTYLRQRSQPGLYQSVNTPIYVRDNKVYWPKVLDGQTYWVHYYGDTVDNEVLHVKRTNGLDIHQHILDDCEIRYTTSSGSTASASADYVICSPKPNDVTVQNVVDTNVVSSVPVDVNVLTAANLHVTVLNPPVETELDAYIKKFPDDMIIADANVGDYTSWPHNSFTFMSFNSTSSHWKFYDGAADVDSSGLLRAFQIKEIVLMFWKKTFDGVDYWIHPRFGGHSIQVVDRQLVPTKYIRDTQGLIREAHLMFAGKRYHWQGSIPGVALWRSFTHEYIAACDAAAEMTYDRLGFTVYNTGWIRPIYSWSMDYDFENTKFHQENDMTYNGTYIEPGVSNQGWRYNPDVSTLVVYHQ